MSSCKYTELFTKFYRKLKIKIRLEVKEGAVLVFEDGGFCHVETERMRSERKEKSDKHKRWRDLSRWMK